MTVGEIKPVMEDIPGHCDVLTFIQMTLRATRGLWATSNRTKGGASNVPLALFTWNNEERKQGVAERLGHWCRSNKPGKEQGVSRGREMM